MHIGIMSSPQLSPVLLPKPLPSVICRCACLRPQTRANGVRALMASLRHCPLLETLLLDDTDLYVPPTASLTYRTARPDVTRAAVLLLYNRLLIHPRPLNVSCRLQRPWRHAEPVQRHPSRYVPLLLHLSAASPSRLTSRSSPATGSLSSLTHLNLAENCLRAKGITHLSAALSSRAAPAGLSHLHLDGCGMDDDVAPAFLHALRFASLQQHTHELTGDARLTHRSALSILQGRRERPPQPEPPWQRDR